MFPLKWYYYIAFFLHHHITYFFLWQEFDRFLFLSFGWILYHLFLSYFTYLFFFFKNMHQKDISELDTMLQRFLLPFLSRSPLQTSLILNKELVGVFFVLLSENSKQLIWYFSVQCKCMIRNTNSLAWPSLSSTVRKCILYRSLKI